MIKVDVKYYIVRFPNTTIRTILQKIDYGHEEEWYTCGKEEPILDIKQYEIIREIEL